MCLSMKLMILLCFSELSDMMNFFRQGVKVTAKCVLLLKMSLIILVSIH